MLQKNKSLPTAEQLNAGVKHEPDLVEICSVKQGRLRRVWEVYSPPKRSCEIA